MSAENTSDIRPAPLRLSRSLPVPRHPRGGLTSRVIDIVPDLEVQAGTVRRWVLTLGGMTAASVLVLFGASILHAFFSGSATLTRRRSEAATRLHITEQTYCPGVPTAAEMSLQSGWESEPSRLFWMIRRFGGALLEAEAAVDVLERGPRFSQVRDADSGAICYLPNERLGLGSTPRSGN